MGAKSSGIDIEPLAVETENLGYIDGLGSNWNVVLNNTVTGSHDFGVFIADDDTANNGGSSCENVIMYNKFSSAYTFGAADFSSMSSTVKKQYYFKLAPIQTQRLIIGAHLKKAAALQ